MINTVILINIKIVIGLQSDTLLQVRFGLARRRYRTGWSRGCPGLRFKCDTEETPAVSMSRHFISSSVLGVSCRLSPARGPRLFNRSEMSPPQCVLLLFLLLAFCGGDYAPRRSFSRLIVQLHVVVDCPKLSNAHHWISRGRTFAHPARCPTPFPTNSFIHREVPLLVSISSSLS